MKLSATNKQTGESGFIQVLECDYLGNPTSVTVLIDPWVYQRHATWVVNDDVEIKILRGNE